MRQLLQFSTHQDKSIVIIDGALLIKLHAILTVCFCKENNFRTVTYVHTNPGWTVVLLIFASLTLPCAAIAQSSSEFLLSTDNAYNPIPSPDGKYVGYIRTGWGEGDIISLGRSSLVSDVKIMDARGAAAPRTLAKSLFLSGWTPDSTRLVCYRDWNYALVSTEGKQTLAGHIPIGQNHFEFASEWVAYSTSLETIIWSRWTDNSHRAIETPRRVVVREVMTWPERVVPSPDGRYLAVFPEKGFEADLRVYDLLLNAWTDLGKISIHPDRNWWYIQPDWNPWFADGSRLLFLTGSKLVIATPDGKQKTEIQVDGPAGLPTPSPDGQSIAYVTFEPRPGKSRPDLQFWGGTTILVVGVSASSEPRAVTLKNPDEVYDLKWLNKDELVFDRVADEGLYQHARIWKTAVAH